MSTSALTADVPQRPSVSPRASTYSSTRSHGIASNSTAAGPLHLKVGRLLSANLDDHGTRTALDTLGEFEQQAVVPSTTAQAAVYDNGAVGGAGIGGALRRGGLRKAVEGRMAEGSKDFLEAFTEVDEKLGMLQSHLDAMHICCDEVQAQLEQANTGTRYLLEHAEGLRQQRTTTTTQQSLVHLFLTRFTLSDAELQALTSRDVPVGPELFAAMDKTERIRGDCRALLSGEAGEGTQAGLDIMEYTSQHLEAGYSKMFKWCSFESRGFNKHALEVSSTMRQAIFRLKARPDLLDEVLSILGTTRSTSILNLFLDALTRGGPGGLPRPIELHAHDPIRYVGDMLAWIHQAMATEREFLESVFGIKEDGRWVGSVRVWKKSDAGSAGEAELDERRLRKLLDRDMEGCGRPLKIRVQQTVKSQEGSIMAYRIASLIHFYHVTMERTIGAEALMSTVLAEITESAYNAFFETLSVQGRSLTRFIQPPSAGLSAPPQLRDALGILREIMAVYNSSLLDISDPATGTPQPGAFEQREADFKRVLDAALDPALDMCDQMAAMRQNAWDRNVFGVNCRETVLTALEGFGFTASRVREIEDDEARLVEELTVEHFGHLLRDSGLESIATSVRGKDANDDTPLSHLPEASSQILTASMTAFSHFLSTTDPLTSPRLSLLPPRIASTIHRAALDRVSRVYADVYDAVMDERNRYEGRSTMLRMSKEDVATLLGLGD